MYSNSDRKESKSEPGFLAGDIQKGNSVSAGKSSWLNLPIYKQRRSKVEIPPHEHFHGVPYPKPHLLSGINFHLATYFDLIGFQSNMSRGFSMRVGIQFDPLYPIDVSVNRCVNINGKLWRSSCITIQNPLEALENFNFQQLGQSWLFEGIDTKIHGKFTSSGKRETCRTKAYSDKRITSSDPSKSDIKVPFEFSSLRVSQMLKEAVLHSRVLVSVLQVTKVVELHAFGCKQEMTEPSLLSSMLAAKSDAKIEEMLDRMLTRLALCDNSKLEPLLSKLLPAALVASITQRLVNQSSDYCRLPDFDMNPRAHQAFYSGCQAIMYILCFRMRYS
ncbi:hypothetical protein VNO77_23357 [Canavalia gladiata]|uniref:Uncharacterized protein n=1 Tax=Canavalia gladiata TaxID=3824 RepID=A0AAN9QBM5_CANGL